MKDDKAVAGASEPQFLTANTELEIGGNRMKLKLSVPIGEMPPESVLPALYDLSNTIVDGVERKMDIIGQEISCKKGCGACCRQLVPISPAEVRLISTYVDNLPEPEQSQMRERFERAADRLRESDCLDRAVNYHHLSEDETMNMIKDYFALGISCPFLVEESCSIYPIRPLICREYLVISSPEHCASLDGEKIRRLQFPVSVAETFAMMDGVRFKGENPYVPLILALEWVEDHGEECGYLPGPNWVQNFFTDLSGKEIPEPELPDSQEAV